MINLLKKIIETPSVSRDEGAVADFLEEWLQQHGQDVHRKGNNLWCETNNQRPTTNNQQPTTSNQQPTTILLNAHIDTVKPASSWVRNPFCATQEGDRIYGLGSNDDGGSLVALTQTFLDIAAENGRLTENKPRFILSLTAEEEVSGKNGIEEILDEIGHIDLGIIGEPTGIQMAVAERGLMVLDCVAKGKSGHAARNEGVNAIYEALPDIDWFRNYRFPKVSPMLGEVKMTVTGINAGTQHNVVPDECRFMVDTRSNDCYSNEEILEMVRQNVKCEVKERSTRLNSSGISLDHPIVKRGLELGLTTFGSPTLSNQALLPFPTLKIGPGDSARSHTADEYICVSEIENAVEIYKKLLEI